MVNLPDTRPEMVAADFQGLREVVKGMKLNIYLIFFFFFLSI